MNRRTGILNPSAPGDQPNGQPAYGNAEKLSQDRGDLGGADRRGSPRRLARCPENFESRAALVGAEIARIEGHEFEAMGLYEQAIRSARENGFVHV